MIARSGRILYFELGVIFIIHSIWPTRDPYDHTLLYLSGEGFACLLFSLASSSRDQ